MRVSKWLVGVRVCLRGCVYALLGSRMNGSGA